VSKKMPKIWEAPRHTLAKIEILRSYLRVWFSILGSTFAGRELWYVDGFAGPGEYTNSPDGSPIAAVRAADAAVKEARSWVAGLTSPEVVYEGSSDPSFLAPNP
jgi:three-Cys-motif partner protein